MVKQSDSWRYVQEKSAKRKNWEENKKIWKQ